MAGSLGHSFSALIYHQLCVRHRCSQGSLKKEQVHQPYSINSPIKYLTWYDRSNPPGKPGKATSSWGPWEGFLEELALELMLKGWVCVSQAGVGWRGDSFI